MFLKLIYGMHTKKVVFRPEFHDFDNFIAFVEKITKRSQNSFKVTTVDKENEVVGIQDQYELEYFIEQNRHDQFGVVRIELLTESESESQVQFDESTISTRDIDHFDPSLVPPLQVSPSPILKGPPAVLSQTLPPLPLTQYQTHASGNQPPADPTPARSPFANFGPYIQPSPRITQTGFFNNPRNTVPTPLHSHNPFVSKREPQKGFGEVFGNSTNCQPNERASAQPLRPNFFRGPEQPLPTFFQKPAPSSNAQPHPVPEPLERRTFFQPTAPLERRTFFQPTPPQAVPPPPQPAPSKALDQPPAPEPAEALLKEEAVDNPRKLELLHTTDFLFKAEPKVEQGGQQGVGAADQKSLLDRLASLESKVDDFNNSFLKDVDQPEGTPDLEVVRSEFVPRFRRVVAVVHAGVNCDQCAARNFSGKRFKCLVCPDFDLCEACESKGNHEHPMLQVISADLPDLEHLTRLYNDLLGSHNSAPDQRHSDYLREAIPFDEGLRREMLRKYGCLKLPLFVKKVKAALGV